jgi:hypothetical protein
MIEEMIAVTTGEMTGGMIAEMIVDPTGGRESSTAV